MLMYTSCGWFFDELSGIETVQVMQYAGRALQLSRELFGIDLEPAFLEGVEHARSNLPEFGNGRRIYEQFVKTSEVDLSKVSAHYGVSSLFEDYADHSRIYCYRVDREDSKLLQSGKIRLALGKVKVTSEITQESEVLTIGVVQLGDHNLTGGVRPFGGNETYERLLQDVGEVFACGDIPELIRMVDLNFGLGTYSLKLLFRDQQRKILDVILESTRAEAEALYRRFYADHASLMRFLTNLSLSPPQPLKMAAEFLVNTDLRRALEAPQFDIARIHRFLEEAKSMSADLDVSGIEYAARRTLIRLANEFRQYPGDLDRIQALSAAIDMVTALPFEVNLWEPQNIYYEILQSLYPTLGKKAREHDDAAQQWTRTFLALGEKLRVRVPSADGLAL